MPVEHRYAFMGAIRGSGRAEYEVLTWPPVPAPEPVMREAGGILDLWAGRIQFDPCTNCTQWRRTVTLERVEGDEYICDVCVADPASPYKRCPKCSTLAREMFRVQVTSGSVRWCGGCLRTHASNCNECGETWANNDMRNLVDGRGRLCMPCYENGEFSTCVGCRGIDNTDNLDFCEDCESYHCNDCECSCGSGDAWPVYNYNYKPAPQFYGDKNRVRYGIELEVNVRGDRSQFARMVLMKLGREHVYLKEDGSLSSGFEIVSHPHTLDEHRKLWGKLLNDRPKGMTSYNSGECGMHVHIERAKLGKLQLGKMVRFFNMEENRKFIEYIAQRTGERWARVDDRKKVTTLYSNDRYEALNLSGSRTAEVRIFRGNLEATRFWKNLEFVDAVVRFAKDCSLQDDQLEFKWFCEWIGKRRKEYPFLHMFLVEGNYVKAASKEEAKTLKELAASI